MAANFPNSPNLNDTFTSNGVTFKWDGSAWKQPASPGVKGLKGDQGEKGEKGQKGEKGEKGTKGEIGSSGNPGGKGDKGAPGADGSDGSDGDKGQKGEKGQKGQDGTDATGTKGQKGDTGSKGQKGEDGSDGSSVKGQKGEVGTTTKGQKGEPGQKGQQGASGSASISNNADNRVITGGTGTNLNAEQNLTFDGSTLNVIGSGTPTIESASNLDITATSTKFSGTASFAGGHPTSNFYSGADDLVVANFTQDTGISIMSGSSNESSVAFGSTTFGSGAIAARLYYDNGNDKFVMNTLTTGHDIEIKSAGTITLGDLNNPTLTIDDMTASGSNYGVEVDGTIYPKITGAAHPYRDLGLSGVRWTNVYATNLHGDGSNITNIPTSAAKSGFAHNYSDTSYSGNSYAGGNFGTHISCSLTPSNSNNRVVVMASFQIKRNGNQNNNVYARARLTGGGDLRECEIVRTNQISYNDSFNQFSLIAYDAAGNTSARTYNLGVNYTTGSGSSGVSIRHASIVAIELKSS